MCLRWYYGNNKFPPDWISKKLLTCKNSKGYTPVHTAAFFGVLADFPAGSLTRELLIMQSNQGNTALHSAFANGRLDDVPRDILLSLYKDDWLIKNLDGQYFLEIVNNQEHTNRQCDALLGLALPPELEEILGTEWAVRNREILDEFKRSEELGSNVPSVYSDSCDVDI